jgi:Nif-specific regulatory protein
MRALLTIEGSGGEPKVYELPDDQAVTIGRQKDNFVRLADEHASRRHAEITRENGNWFIRDLGAMNPTRVNGETLRQKVQLEHGHVINIGKTILHFTLDTAGNGPPATKTLANVQPDSEPSPGDLQRDSTELREDELTCLCQFMTDSVKEPDPRALIRRALETVRLQTGACIAGFLGLEPDDPLPKIVLPEMARVDIGLSRRLTKEVKRLGRAVWLESQPGMAADSESLVSFADALCVPLKTEDIPVGALHVYSSARPFSQRDLHFCEVLGGYLANSLHLRRIQRNLEAENSRLRSHSAAADQLIGDSATLQRLRQDIKRLAPGSSTVLIAGETGVGKELVALSLHRTSRRKHGPLVSVNCAAIAPNLIESELFGYRKGAFTSAIADHPGYFEQADEGTLFLDEVGELPLDVQAKLLRVVEGKGFRPVGATSELRVDVRTIAATNRDLDQEVESGRFRRDLYYRLQGIQIHVPPLRDHREDIPQLVAFFLDQLATEWGRRVRLTDEALRRLQDYSWPGNVRQLRSVLESAVALGSKEIIEPADLALPSAKSVNEPPTLDLEQLEAWATRQALEQAEGNVTQAARLLGISRDTLHTKIKKLGITKHKAEV